MRREKWLKERLDINAKFGSDISSGMLNGFGIRATSALSISNRVTEVNNLSSPGLLPYIIRAQTQDW